jgi:hypothetical protein
MGMMEMRELVLWMAIRSLGLTVRGLLGLSHLLEKASQRLVYLITLILEALRKRDPS